MISSGTGASRDRGFTLVELLTVVVILAVLATLTVAGAQRAIKSSSLATSANNIRQLAAGAMAYLGENNYTFWPWRQRLNTPERKGDLWWWGFEPLASQALGEGKRYFDPASGPLGEYIPGGLRPDPSFQFTGKPFKPKFRFGYLGVGYNVLVAGGWQETPTTKPLGYFELENPGTTVIFATCAQVNTFQRPASPSNPMIEEFYGFDEKETTIHFRHPGEHALVVYATGNAGLLPMDPSTRDLRAPEAAVGRFAPRHSTRFLR